MLSNRKALIALSFALLWVFCAASSAQVADPNLSVSSIPKSEIVGKWREIGKTASIEISGDGAFKAIDNEGMAVAGKYTLVEHGKIRFAIQREGSTEEIVNLGFSINGDELTLTPSEGAEVERYRKEE
jgi:hypothetical protein